jgi:uncharacterized membrane protein YkvA (DUF1232 family)
MTTKFTDFKKTMTAELTGFIQSQARVLSLADLNRLVIDLPALRERFAKISSEIYPYLSDQLEFLSRVAEEQVVREPAADMVGEAAFALLYFQRATDLISDSIPGMGLLDDAIIVRIVLGRSLRCRLDPGDLWHYARPVHSLHLQRLRNPWFAFVVFPACRCRSEVCLSKGCPSNHPLLNRRQDATG